MKKAILTLVIFISLIIVPVIMVSASAPPPPPPPGGDPGNSTPIGGAAPIGSGFVILLSLGAAYGSKKVFDARKKIEE
jgi:hypothetical protein